MRYKIEVEVETDDEPNLATSTLDIATPFVSALWRTGSLVYVHTVSLVARSDEGVMVNPVASYTREGLER